MGPFGPASTRSIHSRGDPSRHPAALVMPVLGAQERGCEPSGGAMEMWEKGSDASGDERLALAVSFLPHLTLLCADSGDSPPIHAGLRSANICRSSYRNIFHAPII